MVDYQNPDPDPKDPRGLQYRAWLWSPMSGKDWIRVRVAEIAALEARLPITKDSPELDMLRAGLEEMRHRRRTPKLKKQRKERLPGGKTRGQLWSGIPRFIQVTEMKSVGGWSVKCSGRLGCSPTWLTLASDEVTAWGKAKRHWDALHRKHRDEAITKGGA